MHYPFRWTELRLSVNNWVPATIYGLFSGAGCDKNTSAESLRQCNVIRNGNDRRGAPGNEVPGREGLMRSLATPPR